MKPGSASDPHWGLRWRSGIPESKSDSFGEGKLHAFTRSMTVRLRCALEKSEAGR